MSRYCPVATTIVVNISRITTVRISVATSGAIFSTPTFAKMAVSAAKPADRNAQINQVGANRVSCCRILSLSVNWETGRKVGERQPKAWRNLLDINSRRTPQTTDYRQYGPDDVRPRAPRALSAQAAADRIADRSGSGRHSHSGLGRIEAACCTTGTVS